MDTTKIGIALERNRALQAKLKSALGEGVATLAALEKDINRVQGPLLGYPTQVNKKDKTLSFGAGADFFSDPATGEVAPKCPAAIAKQQIRDSIRPYLEATAATVTASANLIGFAETTRDESPPAEAAAAAAVIAAEAILAAVAIAGAATAGNTTGKGSKGSKGGNNKKNTAKRLLSEKIASELGVGVAWSAAEESVLVAAVDEYQGHDWPAIAETVNSSLDSEATADSSSSSAIEAAVAAAVGLKRKRNAMACFQHYQQALNPCLVKGPWTAREDEELTEAVQTFGSTGKQFWCAVADQLDGRAPSQCRERWLKSVSPDLNKGSWSELEERVLILAVRAKAHTLPSSSQNLGVASSSAEAAAAAAASLSSSSASSSSSSSSSPSTAGPPTPPLLLGVDFAINWKDVSTHVPGRDGPKCREKWCNGLSPALRHGDWTSAEDDALQAGVASKGMGNWSAVAKESFPSGSRTDATCKLRWGKLKKGQLKEHAKRAREVAGALPAKLNRRKQVPALVNADFCA